MLDLGSSAANQQSPKTAKEVVKETIEFLDDLRLTTTSTSVHDNCVFAIKLLEHIAGAL